MILYWFCWMVLRLYFGLLLRVRVEGLQNVPRRGGLVLCSNHISWLDPLLLGALAPRRLFYMTKAEAFASPPAGAILRTVGAFPVHRHKGDRRAIRHALDLLDTGRIVAVFPEGTRSRDGHLGRAEPGAALLAVWSRREVIPVAISGVYRPGRLTVRFGPAFTIRLPENRRPNAADLHLAAEDQIMGAVRALLRDGGRSGGSRVAIGRA